MVWTTVPAVRTSIFTLDPTSPEDVQVIRGVDPVSRIPPFGDVTVMDPAVDRVSTGVGVGVRVGVDVVEVRVNVPSLVSVIAGLVALVILTR